MNAPSLTVARRYEGLECPLYPLIGLISRKWALDVIYHLHETPSPLRFRELQRRIQPVVTTKELTARLRELESAGLVERRSYDEAIPHVEYALTPGGASLQPLLLELLDWSRNEWSQNRACDQYER